MHPEAPPKPKAPRAPRSSAASASAAAAPCRAPRLAPKSGTISFLRYNHDHHYQPSAAPTTTPFVWVVTADEAVASSQGTAKSPLIRPVYGRYTTPTAASQAADARMASLIDQHPGWHLEREGDRWSGALPWINTGAWRQRTLVMGEGGDRIVFRWEQVDVGRGADLRVGGEEKGKGEGPGAGAGADVGGVKRKREEGDNDDEDDGMEPPKNYIY